MDGAITVAVLNRTGRVESAPAHLYPAHPAKLEMIVDAVRVYGTPGGRYRVEASDRLDSAARWSFVGTAEIQSANGPLDVIPFWESYPPPARFFRAVNEP